ncbi:bone marrow proteoglycan [Perognathus longimembris pacificus]|uniref:bone marrow proteoglycan n=1 Tax=Perognathus longimembris pacificus TaxID=214514 RepID=UPI002019F90F|nr:bone marrow proteoglycan [Perognathus longimembris pacificus]
MKLLLLALLVGAVSALHLMSKSPLPLSPLDDKILKEEEMLTQEAEEITSEERMALEEEEGSGMEEASGEEGAVESVSSLDVANSSLQCPAKEDTVKLVGIPGCKTCRYILHVCHRCYRGNLVSIHNSISNYQIQCLVSVLNQGQVWIGGRISGSGHCQRVFWVDHSPWNFANWAAGQPWACGGQCVSMCVQGGRWRRSHCAMKLPFICSY